MFYPYTLLCMLNWPLYDFFGGNFTDFQFWKKNGAQTIYNICLVHLHVSSLRKLLFTNFSEFLFFVFQNLLNIQKLGLYFVCANIMHIHCFLSLLIHVFLVFMYNSLYLSMNWYGTKLRIWWLFCHQPLMMNGFQFQLQAGGHQLAIR